ncbi:MAG: hypothetical protein D6732_08145 [Methanobacteriota archaeon]|nr:MAG: hypothetical protein D6732_08145 [Euryarchaeota archaeon]
MDERLVRLEERQEHLAADMSEIKHSIKDIAQSLRTLTKLETEHTETRDSLKRAFGRIDELDGRIRSIEDEMPTISLSSKWVFRAALGIIGVIMILIIKLTIKV